MDAQDFDEATALEAALVLTKVLEARTHRKKVLGQTLILPGQLGSALRLPTIVACLQSKSRPRRNRGLSDFQELWITLSEPTRSNVLQALGWYDPRELDWDDPRSNRRPKLPDGQ